MPNSTAQAQDEAQRKLADELASAAECDLRECARDLLIGVPVEPTEIRGWADLMDKAAAALRADPARGAEEMPKGDLRHYPERVGIGGDMGVIDRQFGFVRCILPYDYKYTSNSQQWDEAACICRALEGPMSAKGVATIRALPASGEGGGE